MSDGNYPSGNCPGSSCGSCTAPCQPLDTDSFNTLIARGPLDSDYVGLADAQFDSDTDALGCARWDDHSAECDVETCIANYFCFEKYASYADLEGDPWAAEGDAYF
ncbi:hypothetical protein [Streptosporangium sp. NPDC002524]|uniref:hypothetical protein n=1 Tax=Streptosporangium sp. NPDC002524 TaxID=3154537 RepID=UPI00332F7AA3